MVFRTVYDHLYILHHWVITIPLCTHGSGFLKCMPSSHRNQFSFSPPICAKSTWCTISPIVQGHKGKLFFCHIAILIVLQIVNIFIAVPLAHVHFTIIFWSGFNLLRATYFTNRTRGNMCRNSSYNNMSLQPQCPKKAGSGSLQLVSTEACRSPDSETPHANF